jgi:hypothetical protein
MRGGRVAEVLHDERAVPEDVDHVADVDLAHLGHLLTFLVRRRGAKRGANVIISEEKLGKNGKIKDNFEVAVKHWFHGVFIWCFGRSEQILNINLQNNVPFTQGRF